MALITARFAVSPSSYYIEQLFSLSLHQHRENTLMTMNVFGKIINTRKLPWTLGILQESLPSILGSTCFNDEKIPFTEEVKQTEIGHLFEHILLEYLCQEKLRIGYESAEYSGKTDWNWINDPQGTFHITISSGYKDAEIFNNAVQKSIELMKQIMKKQTVKRMQ